MATEPTGTPPNQQVDEHGTQEVAFHKEATGRESRPPAPKAEKKGVLSLLLIPVVMVCCGQLGVATALLVSSGGDPWGAAYAGAMYVMILCPGAAIAGGVTAFLLHATGQIKRLRRSTMVLVLCSTAVQVWLNDKIQVRLNDKAEAKEAGKQFGIQLGSVMPPSRDFRLHIQNFKWTDYEPEVPEIYIDGRDWSIRYRSVRLPVLGLPDKQCSTTLTPAQADELDILIGAINDGIKAGDPLCDDRSTGPTRLNIAYTGPDGEWSSDVNDDCVTRRSSRDEEAQQLYNLVSQIAPVSWQKEKTICTPL